MLNCSLKDPLQTCINTYKDILLGTINMWFILYVKKKSYNYHVKSVFLNESFKLKVSESINI